METFLPVFESVVLVLGLGLIGSLIIAKRIVPETIVSVLSPLVLDIALPCMVFTNIVLDFLPGEVNMWWALPLWWLGFTVLTLILVIAIGFLFPKHVRRETRAALFFPNAVFVSIAIITGIYGERSSMLPMLFIFTVLFPILLFNGVSFFFPRRAGGEGLRSNWKKVLNPVLAATLLALILKLSSLGRFVPSVVTDVTHTVGRISLPLIMILIGANIYMDFRNKGKIHAGLIAAFLAVKNILFPLAVLGALLLIRPPYEIAFLVFLQSTLPPVTALPLFVKKFGGDVSVTNQYLFSSFVFSLVSIPLAMWLFSLFFTA